jgi:hypothetical protein
VNPNRIWRELANDAFAEQAIAGQYGVFVAMPFQNQFSYQADRVFAEVVAAAIDAAGRHGLPRPFGTPVRADTISHNASEITEDIVRAILLNHLFLADLTLANQGVLVELGVALSLKAPREIVLIAQGDLRALHFNIKDNRVIPYDADDAVSGIAAALADGARSFEDLMGHRMSAVRRSLSPHALYLMDLCRRNGAVERPLTAADLRNDALSGLEPGSHGIVFNSAARELQNRGLMEASDTGAPGAAGFGVVPSRLGRELIRQTGSQRG